MPNVGLSIYVNIIHCTVTKVNRKLCMAVQQSLELSWLKWHLGVLVLNTKRKTKKEISSIGPNGVASIYILASP